LKKPSPVSATPPKQNLAAQSAKQPTSSADKTVNKTQLYINPLKTTVTVNDLKSLYPKSKHIKLKKRKFGPNQETKQ